MDRKLNLLSSLCSNEVHTTGVFIDKDDFTVLAPNEEYGDKIFTGDVKSRLEEDWFNPVMPPELRVSKSEILARVDDALYEWGKD